MQDRVDLKQIRDHVKHLLDVECTKEIDVQGTVVPISMGFRVNAIRVPEHKERIPDQVSAEKAYKKFNEEIQTLHSSRVIDRYISVFQHYPIRFAPILNLFRLQCLSALKQRRIDVNYEIESHSYEILTLLKKQQADIVRLTEICQAQTMQIAALHKAVESQKQSAALPSDVPMLGTQGPKLFDGSGVRVNQSLKEVDAKPKMAL